MKLTVNQRIREVEFFAKKKGVKSFPKYLGISPGSYGNVVGKRQSAPSVELIGAIMRAFPEINPDWLVNGEGEMYRNPQRFDDYMDETQIEGTEPPTEIIEVPISQLDNMQRQIDEIIGWMRVMEEKQK